jgi:hypothetical protein
MLDDKSYFIPHWTFVINRIEQIKKKSSEIYNKYNDINVHNQELTEKVILLNAQKDQLTRRLRAYEPQLPQL